MPRQKLSRTTSPASKNARRKLVARNARHNDHTPNGENGTLSEEELERFRKEKVNFRVNKLGVSRRKAEQWTKRTIEIIRERSHAA
jgi:hypothetical protein